MRLKCDDGKVREFQVVQPVRFKYRDGFCFPIDDKGAKCLECGLEFGFHDTSVLKPEFRKHICKKTVS